MLDIIKNKDINIGIIGLGYVGLPLLLEFGKKDFKVFGFDIDEKKSLMLMQGESYLKHIPASGIKEVLEKGNFAAYANFDKLNEMDAIILCVPTPLTKQKEPDLTYVIDSTKVAAKHMKKGALVALESTTWPGTTDEVLLPILSEGGKEVGKDFYLCFSPEREDPNNPNFKTADIPKIVSGITEKCKEYSIALYEQIVKPIPVSTTRVAEATKLLENIFRSVNIAMVNEMKTIFTEMDIDVWEVIEAAKTKPFGFYPFYPGPGLGGHCIPIDPFYLSWKAKEYDIPARFIELAGEINTKMPYYVVDRISNALNEESKAIKNSKILILGAAYKKDVDDIRESPTLKLIEILREKGACVSYHDPYLPEITETREYSINMKSVELNEANLKNQDCVLISTNHSSMDYNLIGEHAKLVVDTRNAMKDIKGKALVIKA
ncbi:MAG: nucleotide sugar dehydrogenase [Pseudomonadota bacterium]